MPTYQNDNDYVINIVQSPYTLVISPNSTATANFYIKSLPDGVTLTDHDPLIIPWTLLDTITSFPSDDINVASYKSIIVYNASEDVVTISANSDDGNAVVIASATKEVWNNANGVFGILTVLTGSGSVYIWGAK